VKLHDLRPAPGSHTARTRVGRGIAAGKGKTAGRGTKGQKARAGGSIPPWFEGGQTPLHMRIPKLRGFKNRFKTDYEVVNVGAIAALAEKGAFSPDKTAGGKKSETVTINQDILRAVGLVRTLKKPLKILGTGELTTALFVVADAFTKSAAAKIEAAGGTVSVLEVPVESRPAIGVGEETARPAREPRTAAGRAAAGREVSARAAREADTADRAAEAEATTAAKAAKEPKQPKEPKAAKAPKAAATADADDGASDVSEPVDAAEADVAAEPDAATELDTAPDRVDDLAIEPDDAPNPADGADTTEDADTADDENA
jgi:large subunit ribosomal protein L15